MRFAGPVPDVPQFVDTRHIEVTDDPRVLALEAEKNLEHTRHHVNTVLVEQYREQWSAGVAPFRLVSIETRTGCNASCAFCGVNRSADPRPVRELGWPTIRRVSEQLGAAGYAGRIALFGNNEPLLDPRIVAIVAHFREAVPGADLRLLTNGTLLSVDLAQQLFAAGLTTLTVNNYTDGTRLIGPVRSLLRSAATFADVDLRISVRKRDEVLTTRAGTAPNAVGADDVAGFCALPFSDLHVDARGAVNVCCFDAHGTTRLGDAGRESLATIWGSARFRRYRRVLLAQERHLIKPCSACDFDGYRACETGGSGELARPERASA